jgi:hypothetical protein
VCPGVRTAGRSAAATTASMGKTPGLPPTGPSPGRLPVSEDKFNAMLKLLEGDGVPELPFVGVRALQNVFRNVDCTP